MIATVSRSPPVEGGAQVVEPVVGRRAAHPRQQGGDDADRHDGVRQLPEHEGVDVRRVAAPGVDEHPVGGQPDHDEEGQLVGHDVEEDPLRQPGRLPEARAAQVEAGPQREAGRPQRREQRHGLGDDPERRAEAEHEHLGVGDRAGGQRVGARQQQEQQAGRDDDQVVEHRRPHRRGVAPAGVEHRPEHRPDAVEQHLGQEEAGEHDGQLARRGVEITGVEVDEQRRGEHQHDRGGAQHEDGEGEQPLGVGLPAVVVVLGRAHQQRDDDAGEHAPEQQLVDDVGRGVGDVVRRADALDAEHRRDHRGAQEAGGARGHGAERHGAGRAAQAHDGAPDEARGRRPRARRARRTPTATSSTAAPKPVTASAARL
jgi:hypothetical protein